ARRGRRRRLPPADWRRGGLGGGYRCGGGGPGRGRLRDPAWRQRRGGVLPLLRGFGPLAVLGPGVEGPRHDARLAGPLAAEQPGGAALAPRRHLLEDLVGNRRLSALAGGVQELPELRGAQGGEVDLLHRKPRVLGTTRRRPPFPSPAGAVSR